MQVSTQNVGPVRRGACKFGKAGSADREEDSSLRHDVGVSSIEILLVVPESVSATGAGET